LYQMEVVMALAVLVTSGTGRFRPVAELLLGAGHRVRVMTRTPDATSARELATLGADIVAGDFDDPASMSAAARNIDAVFAAGTAHRAGPEGELRHGQNLAEAMAAAGVGHLVYCSGAGADRVTPVPVFESKRGVEQRIRALKLPTTVLAPVYFMENLFNPWNIPALEAGVLPSLLPADRSVQQIPIIDVATFAVLALEHRDDFVNQRIELASDALTGREARDVIASVSSQELELHEVTPPRGLGVLFQWLDEMGHTVKIRELQRLYPSIGWHTFRDWAQTQDWSLLNRTAHSAQPCATP
jgi:uncharacterized protein YbjT (DUF2867 family)